MPNNIPISIPAFREEGDGSPFLGLSYQPKISIPAFREEGDLTSSRWEIGIAISIPAFREEGDEAFYTFRTIQDFISIPAFREEGDLRCLQILGLLSYFNPRLP